MQLIKVRQTQGYPSKELDSFRKNDQVRDYHQEYPNHDRDHAIQRKNEIGCFTKGE